MYTCTSSGTSLNEMEYLAPLWMLPTHQKA